MRARAGDRIQIQAKTKRLAPAARVGTIEEVLNPDQPRYLVRWDDGRTTLIAPMPDTFFVTPKEKAAKAERAKPFTKEPTEPVAPRSTKARSAPKRTKVPKH